MSGFSYGLLLILAAALAIADLISRRGAPGPATAVAGLSGLVPVIFLYLAGNADGAIQGDVLEQRQQLLIVYNQFGYKVPLPRLTTIFGLPLHGNLALIVSAVQPGLVFPVVGGALLSAAGWVELRRAVTRRRPALLASISVMLVASTAMAGMFWVAQHRISTAVNQLHSGSYERADTTFASGLSSDPLLAQIPTVAASIGAAKAGTNHDDALALLAQALAAHVNGDSLGATQLLSEAHALAPNNGVISMYLQTYTIQLARDLTAPQLIADLIAEPHGHNLTNVYSYARVLDTAGQCGPAIVEYQAAIAMTKDTNVVSSALTYESICEQRAGQSSQARATLLQAVAADTEYYNTPARSLVTGLYSSGTP